jgi:Uma2 family endonuclease
MSTQPEHPHLTYAEYLELEERTGTRHEFLRGRVWAMSGGTPRHSALKVNLVSLLREALRGKPCRPYDSDLKLRTPGSVPDSGLSTYADAAVICGPILPDAADPHAATNPTLLAEVLSKSTEAWDRGDKWEHYQTISTLRHYLLVDHASVKVEHYERQADGSWRYSIHRSGDVVHLSALDIHVAVAALYEDAPM